MKNLLEIHAESQAHHGCLEKKIGELFCGDVERMNERESVNDAADESNGRRNETAGGEDQSDKENVFGHKSSVAEGSVRRPSRSSDAAFAQLMGE